jgi:phosphopantothenoylcysteine decarboxylase / phosphopantothenate---cysteine ligase
MLKGKKIVIGITASIAAYKIPYLVRLLIREGSEVRIVMTPSATDFVTPLTLSTLSRNPVVIEPFKVSTGEWNNHVELGTWADAMVFAPVTANTLGKMAHGIADNFLVTVYLSARCPVFIAPAMDLDMYRHFSTRNNISILESAGNTIIEPQVGELASGLSGPGRMEEPENIMKFLDSFLSRQSELAGKKVMVTAGPTYEKLDPVRFIGNQSSGRMGFALAEEAAGRGAEVILIAGPSNLECAHPMIKRIDVVTAAEMYKACMTHFGSADITFMAAAVSDYTFREPSPVKIKKNKEVIDLKLQLTQDILAGLGKKKKKNQLLVGFALETENEVENAVKKLKSKNLDLIVMNSLNEAGAGFNHPTNKVTLIHRSGAITEGELKPKKEVARDILDALTKK